VNKPSSPESAATVAAIVSTDPAFHEGLVQSLSNGAGGVRFGARIGEPFTQIADPHLDRLRELAPDVIFVDLESDPQVGLKFAEYLVESQLAKAVVGAGPTDSPHLLLSAMQAGVVEFLPKPLEAEQVQAAMRRVSKKTGKPSEVGGGEVAPVGRTFCVFSGKGGSGSTTFAVNLAVEIHRLTRKKTLLIDLDLELGETALLLGMEPKFSIVDLIRNFHRVDAGLLASYIDRSKTGVELLAAPLQPVDFESVDGERVSRILNFLKGHYDYIVIDAPKTLNAVTLSAFEGSDELFLVTTPDLPAIRNASRCLPLLKGVEGQQQEDWIHLVVNRFSSRQLISLAEIEKTLGLKVHSTLRNDYQSTMEAINEGRPAVLDKNSIYARDVRKLASGVTGVDAAADKKEGGLLSGLFNRSR
jgi:pilus assembly protein CpaE